VAKILVADDNSNIQKMVGLALKDQGIEVVAVGNGEAAVRRIPDVRPDVVLADVFMPVRNGYEVCEFVKKSDKLSHIPVILLVGAFDPLDEQEAQRVGADGVLKKPFVPPDPLISMVRSALARAEAAAPVPVSAGTSQAVSSSAAAPILSSFPSAAPAEFESPAVISDVPAQTAEGTVEHAPPFAIDEGNQPLAFGSLLDTEVKEREAEADESFMPVRHPGLVEERRWNVTPAKEDEEAEETPSWRRGADDLFDSPEAESTHAVSDWRDNIPAAPAEDSTPMVEASPTAEEAAEAPQPASANALPETSFSSWEQEQAPAPTAEEPQPETPQTDPVSVLSSFSAENFPGLFVEEKAPSVPEPVETTQEPLVEQEFTPPSTSPSSWEEEVRRAARLVATWETSPAAPEPGSAAGAFATRPSETADTWTEPEPAPASASSEPPGGGTTQPSAKSSWPSHPAPSSEPAAPAQFDPPEWYRKFQVTAPEEEQREAASAPPAAEPVEKPDMDALVAKVLERMSPNVLQQVTREILKPMVEALVRNELDKKK
jgi:CheY-like chemotaxis protein